MEQSASAAYPNVLVADYLRKAGAASKAKDAEALVREGYQKLLTFQNRSGGFGWWNGGGDPQVWVTAYAILLLADTARVIDVDRAPIDRARAWLSAQRTSDGTWGTVAHTAYVTWALGGDARAANVLENHLDGSDAYQLALVALALDASGRKASARHAAARLAALEWKSKSSLCYGAGESGSVETAGLAVQALVATNTALDRATKGVEYLVAKRGDGSWGSTQATIQALRALTSTSGAGRPGQRAKLTFRAGELSRSLDVTIGDGIAPSVDLSDFLGRGPITVEAPEGVALNVQAVARHHEPWKKDDAGLKMSVSHAAAWSVGKPVRMSASLSGSGKMVVAEVGLAPGTVPVAASLERLAVKRFEVRSDRVVFYLDALDGTARLDFDVVPRMAAEARVRPGKAYAFYDPDHVAVAPTALVRVTP